MPGPPAQSRGVTVSAAWRRAICSGSHREAASRGRSGSVTAVAGRAQAGRRASRTGRRASESFRVVLPRPPPAHSRFSPVGLSHASAETGPVPLLSLESESASHLPPPPRFRAAGRQTGPSPAPLDSGVSESNVSESSKPAQPSNPSSGSAAAPPHPRDPSHSFAGMRRSGASFLHAARGGRFCPY
jgi:hypothetical protein